MFLRKRSQQGRHSRAEQGAALVEAVLIIPVVLFLTFGAIEFGFAFNEQGNIRAATRTAARAASTQPKASTADFEAAAVDTLDASAENLTNGMPDYALVYDARNGTFSPSSPGECNLDCTVYDWDGSQFVAAGGAGWPPASRAACPGASDRVGVFLRVQHDYLTGLWGQSGISLTSRTVMALEPYPGSDCAGT